MAKKKVSKKVVSSSKNNPDKVMAFVATFLSILGFLIAILTKKNDKYVMYYAKQSLVLFIGCVIIAVISWVSFLEWFANILGIIAFILWIFQWIFAISGKMKPTPLIGRFAEHFNF